MYVGVDGCKKGWLSIILHEDKCNYAIYDDIDILWKDLKSANLILIDIPIGLPRQINQKRLCDQEARRCLGFRRSSVFHVPARSIVYAENPDDYKKKMTGKVLPRQSLAIISKIREVDLLLTKDKTARQKIREVHPEFCFCIFNKGTPMQFKKKNKRGRIERAKILECYCKEFTRLKEEILSNHSRSEVKEDDILDAFVAAITAKLGNNKLCSIPESVEIDEKGLKMEICYHKVA